MNAGILQSTSPSNRNVSIHLWRMFRYLMCCHAQLRSYLQNTKMKPGLVALARNSVLGRLKQKDHHRLEASSDYRVRPCLKETDEKLGTPTLLSENELFIQHPHITLLIDRLVSMCSYWVFLPVTSCTGYGGLMATFFPVGPARRGQSYEKI